MNVIFGIIIDTFGALRDETSARMQYMKDTSFISSLVRADVDKEMHDRFGVSNGFTHLEEKQQNRWSYLNYLFYLELKWQASAGTDYSGIETYVRSKLDQGDVNWLPIERCKMLDAEEAHQKMPETSDFVANHSRCVKKLGRLTRLLRSFLSGLPCIERRMAHANDSDLICNLHATLSASRNFLQSRHYPNFEKPFLVRVGLSLVFEIVVSDTIAGNIVCILLRFSKKGECRILTRRRDS